MDGINTQVHEGIQVGHDVVRECAPRFHHSGEGSSHWGGFRRWIDPRGWGDPRSWAMRHGGLGGFAPWRDQGQRRWTLGGLIAAPFVLTRWLWTEHKTKTLIVIAAIGCYQVKKIMKKRAKR